MQMFPYLSRPIKIGNLELPNRMTTAPMVFNFATEQGGVTQRLIESYRALGRGGWGLVMVGASYINKNNAQFTRMQGIYDDRLISGLAEQAEAVKEGGCKVGIQLQHSGAHAPFKLNGVQAVAPSAVAGVTGVIPRALTAEEVEETMDEYVAAALRAKAAGFDLVMLHGAHGFLIHQFISPITNKREDKWAGPSAYVVELIRRVKKAVGASYPVSIRISGAEDVNAGAFGADLGLMVKLSPFLVEAGVDCIDVSAGSFNSNASVLWGAMPVHFPAGGMVHLAEAIKKVVTVPVVTAGRIVDPFMAEEIVARGRADLVAFGRGSLADPELALKALTGNVEDIRRCISCQKGCGMMDLTGARCSINYQVGKLEYEYKIRPVCHPKKVLVVGGGPAGMEAARVASLRGHKVTLCEASNSLGGQLIVAAVPPHKEQLSSFTHWLIRQLEKSDIEIKLGVKVTREQIDRDKPDVVIIAAGLTPKVPDIPGLTGPKMAIATDVLLGKSMVGETIAIVGGELVACETADYFSDRGKKVTVLRRGSRMATNVPAPVRYGLLNRLRSKGVVLIADVKEYKTVNDAGLVIVDKEGKERTIAADTIVVAAGGIPNKQLGQEIRGKVPEVYEIGDCARPSDIMDAIQTANRVALEI